MNHRSELAIMAPDASAEEAAAVVAALARFMRETALVPVSAPPAPSPWQQTALHEGVARSPQPPAPWI